MEPSLKLCVYPEGHEARDAPWPPRLQVNGIPWHRVVGERGKILIRGPYAMLQKKLLESEGVTIMEVAREIENSRLDSQDLRVRKFTNPERNLASQPIATPEHHEKAKDLRHHLAP